MGLIFPPNLFKVNPLLSDYVFTVSNHYRGRQAESVSVHAFLAFTAFCPLIWRIIPCLVVYEDNSFVSKERIMSKELWINLPVRDIAASRAFFQAIGLPEHDQHRNNPDMVALQVGNTMVMLFPISQFERFAGTNISDTGKGCEILISYGAGSKEEVDEVYEKVKQTGVVVFGPPRLVDGSMYGMGFCDPDGHRWNMLWMEGWN